MVRGPSSSPGAPHVPYVPRGGASAMPVLVALLDRSVEQIAQAAADVRWFDREAICAAADVWDNNVQPLFWAVCTSSAAERERRARKVLEWMAALGERRRAWMTERAAVAGYAPESFLAPAAPDLPGRDSLGHVRAPQCRLTPQYVEDLVADYALATASVRHLRFERAGTRLTAFLRLAADRRFSTGESAPASPALVDLRLEGVTDAVFDFCDPRGVVVDAGRSQIAISLGTGDRIRAQAGECRVDDGSWHQSAAGRRADALTPPRTAELGRLRPPQAGGLGTDAGAAALLLQGIMLELRSVRYAKRADHVPVLRWCRVLEHAGAAILAAGSRRGSRRRQAAFRDVIRTWGERADPDTARRLAGILKERTGRADLIEVPRAPERRPPSLAGSPSVSEVPVPVPSQAVLTMVAWTAAHTGHLAECPATAQLQLAVPPRPDETPSAPWRLRTVSCTDPDAFHVHTDAFQGPGSLIQLGKPTAACSLDLHQGALLISAEDGWSASVT
ncbi:hypothetical protein AB0399_23360 [Streptomyces sp. NPDC088194]|uniref:hypothetical protein n=1 Tax=Streptomyces sp. NPDC088194 TaxID=3154931 RepID=UPI00345039B5